MRIVDTLVNLVAGLGTGKDKAAADAFAIRPLSEPEAEAMYHGDWVARKIVELPVRDMLRSWRTWQASANAATALELAEKRHRVRAKLARALVLARVHGGSAIIIGADVADPAKPLNLRAVRQGGLAYLTVVPRRQIVPGPPDRDPRSPTHGEPKYYTLHTGGGAPVTLHPSRVIRFIGAERVDLMGESEGWGFSALQAPYEAVHHAALASGAAASMLHEAKVDVIQIQNLGSTLQTPAGTDTLLKRFGLANTMKSINNTLLLDTNDKWSRTQTAFTGVPQLLERFMAVAAAAADIPAARFLAQSASGLNASGDADLRNYYDRLAGERADVLTPIMERLDELLWRDATGAPAPRGAMYEWVSLWQPTDKERADTAKVLSDVIRSLVDVALLPEEALRAGVENALIESGIFPGLENALALASVAVDPAGEDDEAEPASPSENVAPRDAIPSGRARLAAAARAARERRLGGCEHVHH